MPEILCRPVSLRVRGLGCILSLVSLATAAAGPLPLAHAETVTGRFTYADRDPATKAITIRPIVGVRVEVHRFRPRFLGIWAWGEDASTTTDGNGRISIHMTSPVKGVVYAVKVTASSRAAIVWPNDFIHTVPFHVEPGEPEGRPVRRVARSRDDVLNFDYAFKDEWSAQHFNIAETIRQGYAFVMSRRDPRERDVLAPVAVQPTSLTGSWFNVPFDTLVIASSHAFADLAILHEYGHFVSQHIGTLFPLPSYHDGCRATLLGQDVSSAAVAWSEGFADWFAVAVDDAAPAAGLTGYRDASGVEGTFTPRELNSPGPCSLLPDGDRIERRVAGALWRLGMGSGATADDGGSREIMQIADRELDAPDGPVRAAPDISAFRAAWTARGVDACDLGPILRYLNIPFRSDLPPVLAIAAPRSAVTDFRVSLSASASCDPDLKPLQYAWHQTGGPRVHLTDAHGATTSFRAPPFAGAVRLSLTASDGRYSRTTTTSIRIID